ncbi:WXG100 family type VII secretion target [Microbacterium sp. ZXX196]|uniref:WXG100 family type VII secretion target n=1 Tax=Microbacterium sp. ZXX196 TaxID=2609291 RepID=UPI0012B73569|nr:WXG100 family type VII secretion target [Microbacterium sp. ZXX196]MTE23419.1 WXG100 family type VII secretion target [Microbacterium sp. ZXX196]
MTQFQVDSDALLQAQAEAQASSERLRAEVALLMGRIHQLEATWQGGASQAFQGLAAEWQAVQARVEEGLQHLAQRLQAAGTGYQQAEADIAGMFR